MLNINELSICVILILSKIVFKYMTTLNYSLKTDFNTSCDLKVRP